MFDLLIIGGGINGSGIARDATGRGLKVFLCEKNDLASATSSASTKLIHGGLRYLEHYDFALVRKALIERETLLKAAPHIIWPLRFVLPHHRGLRPAWLVRLGLFLYDHLGGRKILPATKTLHRKHSATFEPLNEMFQKGFEYSDCWVEDSRLVVLNAVDAAERGASVETRSECIALKRQSGHWVAKIKHENGYEKTVKAKAIINAAGPWVDKVSAIAGHRKNAKTVRLVKGSHIIVPSMFAHEKAYIFQATDGRVIFAIPYENNRFTLIGTTDLAFDGNPDQVTASDEEIAYLCDVTNSYFKAQIKPADIVSTYSGVRPLYDDQTNDASSVTRDYVLSLDETDGAPYLTVLGGKITTYRKLAEDALKQLSHHFPKMGAAWTEKIALPGGDIESDTFEAFAETTAETFDWMEPKPLHRLQRTYGTRIYDILKSAKSIDDLGPHFGAGLYQKEVEYLIEREFARSAEDIVKRRTKLGLHMTSEEIEALQNCFFEAADTPEMMPVQASH